jgi:hypothetical protein
MPTLLYSSDKDTACSHNRINCAGKKHAEKFDHGLLTDEMENNILADKQEQKKKENRMLEGRFKVE